MIAKSVLLELFSFFKIFSKNKNVMFMHSYKKYDKTHHDQYLLATKPTIIEFSMHLPQTRLEQQLHVSRVLLVQLLLWQCFRFWLFCILLLV